MCSNKNFTNILSKLNDVSETKRQEIIKSIEDIKENEEEFLRCFYTDMSAIERYNLEKEAEYDEDKNDIFIHNNNLIIDNKGLFKAENKRGNNNKDNIQISLSF